MRSTATTIAMWAVCLAVARGETPNRAVESVQRDPYGAVIRGDVTKRQIALIFTGDEFGEGTPHILDALGERSIPASFFVTGNFLRKVDHQPWIRRIVDEGHYLGPHSDSHPLYCDWDDRGQSLITEAAFAVDLKENIAALRQFKAPPAGIPLFFVPPYEWYNADQVRWSRQVGVVLINFTPGSGSNRDYAKEGNPRFVPSQTIIDDILSFEQRDPHGLNGFLLLMHLGSGRKDPLHNSLGRLCDVLAQRGYQFVRIDAMMKGIKE